MYTPLEKLGDIYDNNYEIFVKRDDLYPISGGGNKGRKAKVIFEKCLHDGKNAVVTCGGAQSNHLRATAIMCRQLGLQFTAVIHANKPGVLSGNLQLLQLLGVRIVFCDMSEVAEVMDAEMERFRALSFDPFYIYGGGHSVEGTYAYVQAVNELASQSPIIFDKVFHASGTGATQAGLHIGFGLNEFHTEVIGISVAREQQRGKAVINASINEYLEHYQLTFQVKPVHFDDSCLCGGYEKTTKELLSTISQVAKLTGIILDPTYTGKAWLGMKHFMDRHPTTKKQKILFWHTGGLLNLMAY